MINKILAIADIHFRNYQRRSEYQDVIDKLYDEIKQTKPDRVVICGDIVHSYTQLTTELVYDTGEFLRTLASLVEKVIIIPGNHDFIMRNKSRMDSITSIVNTLRIDNIVYYKNYGVYEDDNVNWVVYSLMNNNARPSGFDYKDPTKKYIGLFHGNIEGMSTASGFELGHGLSRERFDGCDLVLCGDIHKRQILYLDEIQETTPIIMIGSLIQQDHGETINGHGYCLVELDDEIKFSFKDLENPIKYYTFVLRGIEELELENEILIN